MTRLPKRCSSAIAPGDPAGEDGEEAQFFAYYANGEIVKSADSIPASAADRPKSGWFLTAICDSKEMRHHYYTRIDQETLRRCM